MFNRKIIIAIFVFICLGLFLFFFFRKSPPKTIVDEAGTQTIEIVADQSEFTPSVIRVKVNQPVKLHIKSEDALYSFKLEAFGIHEDISPGRDTTVTFTPTKKGKYEFKCSLRCGVTNYEVDGIIIVE